MKSDNAVSNASSASSAPKSSILRVKPTIDTPFHIDYSWWEKESRDLRSYLIAQLPSEQRALFESGEMGGEVDYVDPDTGEVRRLDSLTVALQEATSRAEFLGAHATLVDAVFRVFLANGNKPLTIRELAELLNRPATTLLKTIAGTAGVVYKGVRPLIEE